jgi:predicted RNA binding protein YcfA (HicA-like mRNA interferase family)
MPEMTYAQMDKVLSALGFTVRVVTEKKKLRVYEHPATGARLALAFRPDDDAVLPHHLAAIQGTVKVYGIADSLDFAVQPQKAS